MQQTHNLPAMPRARASRHTTYELEIAVVLLGGVTAIYILGMRALDTAPGAFFGHMLGTIGFLLMLATETLYSLRKRARGRTIGRLSDWLQWHIVTGIVGSYMVILHTAWRFNGLAGIVALLTAIIVVSGFIGRYFYTAIPRGVDGAELTLAQLEERLAASATRLEALARAGATPGSAPALSLIPPAARSAGGPLIAILTRPFLAWRDRAAQQRALNALGYLDQTTIGEIRRLLAERHRLLRQMETLALARRLLALWHTIHIPLGVALFILAFTHIGAALYYATLLH